MAEEILRDCYLIDLDQPRRGFRKFISSWLIRRRGKTILVDPGPRSTIPHLMEELEQLAVNRIDLILITHVHLDHVGGLGCLLHRYPSARVVCKPATVRHLVDPSKLWNASKKALGDLTDMYGSVEPCREEVFVETGIFDDDGFFEIIETPGHASHHRCYRLGDVLFAGEVAGVFYPHEEGPYLRIASPAPFFYTVYRTSLLKAASLDVSHACFAHYGHSDKPSKVFKMALDQLDLWVSLTERHHLAGSEPLEDRVFDDLLEEDRALKLFCRLPDDIRERERFFARKSIRGIRTWIEEKQAHTAS